MNGFMKRCAVTTSLLGAMVVAQPASASALVNLALGAAVTASSQDFGAATNANDGSLVNTYPNVFQTGQNVNPFWIVDLGASYTLNDVHIYQRNTSEDGGQRELYNWTLTLFSGGTLVSPTGVVTQNTFDTAAPNALPDFDVTTGVTGQNARFVKINLNATDFLALAEVQVFQAPAAEVAAVPEPATLGLALLGLVGAVAARRRRSGGAAA